MNADCFVESIKLVVRDSAIEDVLANLENPPGRQVSTDEQKLSEWFNQLLEADKNLVAQIVTEAVDEAVFGMLAVLDGVRAIDTAGEHGELRLIYVKENEIRLNDPHNEKLHDRFNSIT